MSALSQSTRFWIDSSVAMGASAMSSYLTAGRQDGPEDGPGRSARGRRERRLRLGGGAVAEEGAPRQPRPRHLRGHRRARPGPPPRPPEVPLAGARARGPPPDPPREP